VIAYEYRLSEARFPSYGLLAIKENAQNAHLDFPRRHCWRQASGTLLPPITSDGDCLPRLPAKRPSRAVARCISPD